jgi:hypothetical protein
MQNNINGWDVKAEEQQHKVARERSLCAGESKLHGAIYHTGHRGIEEISKRNKVLRNRMFYVNMYKQND